MQLKSKNNNKKLIYSWLVLIFLFVILIFLLNSNLKAYKKVKDSDIRKNIFENNLIELQDRKNEIAKDIERLNSPVGQEEELRNRFNVSKEDEKVIIIVEEEIVVSETEITEDNQQSFWQKIKSVFFR
jgi:cell division protein FtsB